MNTITLKNYSNFIEAKLDDTFDSKFQSIALLTGRKLAEVTKMPQKKIIKIENELAAQIGAKFNPVSMVKYRGKVLGYYPCDLGVIEDLVALEHFQEGKNLNALAALMFRECTGWTSWINRKRWTKSFNIKAKPIGNFVKDFTKYRCKPIQDFNKIDLDFYDDFPLTMLYTSMAFLIGAGANSYLKTLDSQKMMETHQKIQEVILGMQWLNISQNMEKIYSNSKESAESSRSLLGQLLIGSDNKKLKVAILQQAKELETEFEFGRNVNKALTLIDKTTVEGLYNLNLFTFDKKSLTKQGRKLWLGLT